MTLCDKKMNTSISEDRRNKMMGKVSTADGQRHSCTQPESASNLREGGATTGREVLRTGEKSKINADDTQRNSLGEGHTMRFKTKPGTQAVEDWDGTRGNSPTGQVGMACENYSLKTEVVNDAELCEAAYAAQYISFPRGRISGCYETDTGRNDDTEVSDGRGSTEDVAGFPNREMPLMGEVKAIAIHCYRLRAKNRSVGIRKQISGGARRQSGPSSHSRGSSGEQQ